MISMNRQAAIAILQRNADALRARGVRHAALFGSMARGDAGVQSDIDIMIDLDPDARLDVFAYVGLKRFIEELFDRPVDIVDRNALKPYVRGPAIADAINAF
jgi:predicted nucleotidyltransferase